MNYRLIIQITICMTCLWAAAFHFLTETNTLLIVLDYVIFGFFSYLLCDVLNKGGKKK